MSLPLLAYQPKSQNHRVNGYEVPGDDQPRIYRLESVASNQDMDLLIRAAYRQIFHEQQMLKSNRQTLLESQLRAGLITVKGFIRGLATCDSFRAWNYHPNNNYRFVELCVQRILGRNVYDRKETLAWSIVLASQGLQGLIDGLLATPEYEDSFGENTVPYQRRRILPQRSLGELPFERTPRYGQDHLTSLQALGYDFCADRPLGQQDWLVPPAPVRRAAGVITLALALVLGLTTAAVVFSWFGWITL
ncbi:MAG: phycobilisome rod-core linker polypeptide [Cyanobacteria bacterium REEB459]|nr:phycobilisome rod-core linker polypeptide [Cyanobacteria bacterium REEB459]